MDYSRTDEVDVPACGRRRKSDADRLVQRCRLTVGLL